MTDRFAMNRDPDVALRNGAARPAVRPHDPPGVTSGDSSPNPSHAGTPPAVMAPTSILFHEPEPAALDDVAMPSYFADLNFDQIVQAITAGRAEYNLAPYFHVPLNSVAAIEYRQAVAQDIDQDALRRILESFAAELRSVRKYLSQGAQLRHPYQRQRWFVDAAAIYLPAVRKLNHDLANGAIRSEGLRALLQSLTNYVDSDTFASLAADTESLENALARVNYCLHIRGNRVTVSKFEGQSDYSDEVARTFARFKQGDTKSYRVQLTSSLDLNHVESRVLELVANLYPETFAALGEFSTARKGFLDPAIAQFDREAQFYLGYLDYLNRVRKSGLEFCYPTMAKHPGQIVARDTFDLALADKLAAEEAASIVCNDIELNSPERIAVVSGPNQGGKTTLARTFGQIHHLGSLGLAVPGKAAELSIFDRIFTHFEREESLDTLRGKLQDDLVRIHEILGAATTDSVIIMNELFTSTTVQDAVFLGTRIVRQIIDLDALCVYVTFVDELSLLGPTTVSLVSTVNPDRPEERTYKIVRRPADGPAHAIAIADKYGLTYHTLKGRLGR